MSFKRKIIYLLMVILEVGGLIFSTAGKTLATSYQGRSLANYARKTLQRHHLRGTLELVQNGQAQTVNVGYGYYGRRIVNGNSKLVYPVGSLQKTVTAAMITQLIYQNKLSQNTKISRWYPFLRNAAKITVGQLMTHTSGINVGGTESSHGILFSENGALKWLIAKTNLSSRTALNHFNYNNANYVLLAGIIRRVTGKSYAANFNQRIIKPLHLKQTYLYADLPRGKTDAISYLYQRGKNYQSAMFANPRVVSQLPGAGNMFSSAKDYYQIQRGLINGKILTARQFNYLAHLKAKVNTYSGGFYFKKKGSLKLAYGNFGDTHFVNWMQLTTDNRNGLVMFLNQTHGNKNQIKAAGYRILKQIKANTFVKR